MEYTKNLFRTEEVSISRNFLTKYITICSVSLALCCIGFFKTADYDDDSRLMRTLGSASYHSALKICAAFTVPSLTDPIMEYLESGKLSVFKWFKVVLLLGLGVPNLLLLQFNPAAGSQYSVELYLTLTYAQTIGLLGAVLGQLHYLGSSIWTADRTLIMVVLLSLAQIAGIGFRGFKQSFLTYLVGIFGFSYVSVLAYYSYLWFNSEVWLSVFRTDGYTTGNSAAVAMKKKQEEYSSNRNIRRYGIFVCSYYIALIWIFYIRAITFGFVFSQDSVFEVSARAYAQGILTLLVIILQDRRIYMQLTESQDELQNKRIFVQYVTQEASKTIKTGKRMLRTMMDDTTIQITNVTNRLNSRASNVDMGGMNSPHMRVPNAFSNENLGSLTTNAAYSGETVQQLGLRLENLAAVDDACDVSLRYLKDLLTFDKFESDLILSNRVEVTAWKFLRSQVDFFTTQAVTRKVQIRKIISVQLESTGVLSVSSPQNSIHGAVSTYGIEGDALESSDSNLQRNYDSTPQEEHVHQSGNKYRMMQSPAANVASSATRRRNNAILQKAKIATIFVSQDKIAQVLKHVIANAINHAPYNTAVTLRMILKEVSRPKPNSKVETKLSKPESPRPKNDSVEGGDESSFSARVRRTSWHGGMFHNANTVDLNPDDYVVRIEVTDQGAGISKAQQETLFKKKPVEAYQAGKISLWLCRMIVEMHGGSFGCISPAFYSPKEAAGAGARGTERDVEQGSVSNSNPAGGGSTFYMEIPVRDLNTGNMENSISNSILSNRQIRIVPGDTDPDYDSWSGKLRTDRELEMINEFGKPSMGHRSGERCVPIDEGSGGSPGAGATFGGKSKNNQSGGTGSIRNSNESGHENSNNSGALASRLLASAASLLNVGLSRPKSASGSSSSRGSRSSSNTKLQKAQAAEVSGDRMTTGNDSSLDNLSELCPADGSTGANQVEGTSVSTTNHSAVMNPEVGMRRGGRPGDRTPPRAQSGHFNGNPVAENEQFSYNSSKSGVGGGGNTEMPSPKRGNSTNPSIKPSSSIGGSQELRPQPLSCGGYLTLNQTGQSIMQARNSSASSLNSAQVRIQKHSDPIPIQWNK